MLIKVFNALNRHKVRYLVAGGVATVLYGNPRFTKDLDLLVDLKKANLRKLVDTFKSLKFIPRVPVKAEEFISERNRADWHKEKGMLAFTFINPRNPLENVDILFISPLPFGPAYKRKKIFKWKNVAIPAVCAKDLIFMKEKSGRVQDLYDIEVLRTTLKKL